MASSLVKRSLRLDVCSTWQAQKREQG